MVTSFKPSLTVLVTAVLIFASGIILHHYASRMLSERLESTVLLAVQAANQDLTQLFINDLYDEIEPTVSLSASVDPQSAVLSENDYERINTRIREFMLGTDILKIKLYNLKGITRYSSDPRQLGVDYSESEGFISALRGRPFSISELRTEFAGYSGTVYDRDVVSSYVPVRRSLEGGNVLGRVIGVAEIYVDRTQEMQTVRNIAGEISFLLALGMFIALVLISGFVWFLSLRLTEHYISTAELNE